MTLGALASANVLALVLVLAAPGTAAAAPVRVVASAPSSGPSVKYYVVGAGVNGQREYLFAIAAKTLGNGNRYWEIYALNQGRVQADGRRLIDPAILVPGWVLQLPADATGPDVHVGPLPDAGTGQIASPDVTTATRSTVDDIPSYSGATPRGNAGLDTAVRTIAMVTMVVLLGVAMRLLRRGTRVTLGRATLATAAPPVPEAPWRSPPGRFPTAPPMLVAATEPGLVTPTRPAVRTAVPPAVPAATVAPAAPTGVSVAEPAPAFAVGRGTPASGLAADPPARLDRSAAAERTIAGRPDLVFRAQLRSCGDVVDVQLAGARSGRDHMPYNWVRPGDPFPAGVAVAALGDDLGDDLRDQPRGELFVDLTASPDVITVTGPAPARLRQAQSLARQLHLVGVTVIAVGDVLGRPAPAGCRSVTTWDGRTAADFPVVVFHPGPGDEATAAVGRAGTGMSRAVLVLVGDVRRARWSIDVQPASPPRAERG